MIRLLGYGCLAGLFSLAGSANSLAGELLPMGDFMKAWECGRYDHASWKKEQLGSPISESGDFRCPTLYQSALMVRDAKDIPSLRDSLVIFRKRVGIAVFPDLIKDLSSLYVELDVLNNRYASLPWLKRGDFILEISKGEQEVSFYIIRGGEVQVAHMDVGYFDSWLVGVGRVSQEITPKQPKKSGGTAEFSVSYSRTDTLGVDASWVAAETVDVPVQELAKCATAYKKAGSLKSGARCVAHAASGLIRSFNVPRMSAPTEFDIELGGEIELTVNAWLYNKNKGEPKKQLGVNVYRDQGGMWYCASLGDKNGWVDASNLGQPHCYSE